MKKLAIIALMLSGITMTAQRHEGKRNDMQDLTPQQAATLQTKKMTLALDLNPTQQKELESILVSNAVLRKAKIEKQKASKEEGNPLSKEEKFAMQNERLDHMIAHKAEMKKLLTTEQYGKWEKMRHKKGPGKKRNSKDTKRPSRK